MSEKVRTLFHISRETFPSGEWIDELRQKFGATYGKRSEEEFPSWMKITGKSYVLWLSDPKSLGREKGWLIALERIKNITPEGIEVERDLIDFSKRYFPELQTTNA